MTRNEIIEETAQIINKIEQDHPIRIGIDGVGASGKTYFADELVQPLENLGRTVIRASIDGFHNPPEVRRKQGALSASGYLEDSFNYKAVLDNVLLPLGPSGNLTYRESIFNFVEDEKTDVSICTVPTNAILIFEGVFLFNEYLFPHFDYKLFIDTSFEETFNRAKIRDVGRLGGMENLTTLYNQRYIPGQKMYLKKYSPIRKADIVINNNDYKNPYITKLSSHKLHQNTNLFVRNSI